MTAMCRLVQRHMSRGNARAVVSYLIQRQNSGFADVRLEYLGFPGEETMELNFV